MKKLLPLAGRIVFILSVVITFGFIAIEKQNTKIRSVAIRVDHTSGSSFVDRESLQAQLKRAGLGNLEGKPLTVTQLKKLETEIEKNAFVMNAEAYSNQKGEVGIDVTQRVPVLRIINAFQESFYIDQDGLKMPVSTVYSAKVLVANGNISEKLINKDSCHTQTVKDLLSLVNYLKEDEFRNSLFTQVYVNLNKEFEMVPRVGNHTVLLGSIEKMEEKMDNLLVFYKKGMGQEDWLQVKQINIKFKDQVVCTKW